MEKKKTETEFLGKKNCFQHSPFRKTICSCATRYGSVVLDVLLHLTSQHCVQVVWRMPSMGLTKYAVHGSRRKSSVLQNQKCKRNLIYFKECYIAMRVKVASG